MTKNLTIPVNGIFVSYKDSGKGDIPIVFIHGFPFNKSTWDPQFEFFKQTHRVIAYDLRGFGESTPGTEKFSIDLFADDLIEFLDSISVKEAIVCGLSMGGYILLNATRRYPERIKALILSSTQCLADTLEAAKKRFDTIAEIKKNGLIDFSEAFLKKSVTSKTLEENKVLAEKIKNIILDTSIESITLTLEALAERKETCTGLKTINAPSLIICGKDDTLIPYTQSEFLFNHIEGSKMHCIEQAGHLVNLEQIQAFNTYMFNFIQQNFFET